MKDLLVRRDEWERSSVRLLVRALVVFQVLQGLWLRRELPGFQRSYWAVTYDEGFVRRGLGGEVLDAFVGPVSAWEAGAATLVVAGAAVVAAVVVIELLLRQGGERCALAALLLAASPFLIDHTLLERRPDHLVIVVLVAVGLGLRRTQGSTRLAVALAAGVAMGLAGLANEAALLVGAPLLLVLVADDRRAVAAALAAPAVAAGLLLGWGTPSPAEVERLREVVPWVGDHSVFDYLADTPGDAVRAVVDLPPRMLAATFVLGTAFVVLHVRWLSRWAGVPRPPAWTWAVIATAAAVLLLTGKDWFRWFGELGAAGLVVGAFTLLASAPARAAPAPLALPRAAPLLAVALAGVRFLDPLLAAKNVVRVFFGFE